MKTQKTKLVLSIIVSILLLITFSSCGEKTAEEKEMLDSGKLEVVDFAGKTNLLTVADIENVSGVNGIKLVEKGSLPGAGGNLNFATADDKMYAMLVIADMTVYDQWKEGEKYVHKQLSSIGDEAYSAPDGEVQSIVFFREGSKVGSVSSHINFQTGEPYLNIEQLSNLARTVVSRM